MMDQLELVLGKGRIIKNKNLFSLLSLHTDTTAEFFFEAQTKNDLVNSVRVARKLSMPLILLGGGSNMAITKKIIKGLVVKNMYIKKSVLNEKNDFVDMMISSGYPVSAIIQENIELGYEGLEYHKGLPGSVGGAIYMNSKWTHPVSYFTDSMQYAHLVDHEGKERKAAYEYFAFAYDYSKLQETHEIVLDAVFRFRKTEPDILIKRASVALQYRVQTQPSGVFTAGCFFKNISDDLRNQKGLPTKSAGYLIDKAGLKGVKIGDYYVSDKHANFIVNGGKGNPEDLASLLKTIKKTVKEKFNVELEEEVVII